jgi:hypothetical protein
MSSSKAAALRLSEGSAHETEIAVIHELATDAEASSHTGGWSPLLGRPRAFLEGT